MAGYSKEKERGFIMSKQNELLTDQEMEERYIKNLKDGIAHFKSILVEMVEAKEEGLDHQKLYQYAENIINKQSALIEALEEKLDKK